MKKNNYILLFFSVGFILMLSLFLIGSHDVKTTEISDAMSEEGGYMITSTTVSAPVPDVVEFCGKEIRLDRYDMRERFDREINAFTYLHSTTMLMIKRANRYFPIIEPILKKNGIPDDFKYLAVIESSLDTRAVSIAKATGMWQFMEATGKQYGLEINAQVDERYHVEKATEAACRYLKDAYALYGDWPTVSASYNAGTGRISSEMRQQQVKNSFDLLLVSETSRYVFRIIAAKQVFESPARYGFRLNAEDLYMDIPTRKVNITESVNDLAQFAIQYGLNYAQLKDFNPWLRDRGVKVTPGKSYTLDLPRQEDLFYDKKNIKVHDRRWIAR